MKDSALFSKTIEYLKEKMPLFKEVKRGGLQIFTCPKCGHQESCTFTLPDSMDMMSCHNCGGMIGDIVAMVRMYEKDKENWPNDEIVQYLCKKYNIPVPTTDKDIQETFKLYRQLGFDLVPVQNNGKSPIEKDWCNKSHKDIKEWNSWLEKNCNLGIKTGKNSNVTIIDFDTKDIPTELFQYIKDYKGITQSTRRGTHYFFQYEPDLPKTNIEKFKLDIENDKGQVIIYPSIVDNTSRKLNISSTTIPKMPEDLKKFLLSNLSVTKKKDEIQVDENFKFNIEDLKLKHNNLEGCCTTSFLQLGAMLKKQLSMREVEFVLKVLNRHLLEYPMETTIINKIFQSLDKYEHQDLNILANKILQYLKIVGEASGRDCKEIAGEKKEIVDKTLSSLIKEGYIIKKNRQYHFLKKAEWKERFFDDGQELNFKVPYFDKYAILNFSDMILLGAKNKVGKTSIAMNIMKQLVSQGIKPHYISLESGSRWKKTAIKLGLKEGDFYWDFVPDPTKIELEPNAVTVIDWLMIEAKETSDTVFKYFVEQLYKTNGFLIVFMQLKQDGTWFAPNMVTQFPALAAKYIYDNEEDGTYGKWIMSEIREPRFKIKKMGFPCVYDFESRILTPMDEIQKDETNVQPVQKTK